MIPFLIPSNRKQPGFHPSTAMLVLTKDRLDIHLSQGCCLHRATKFSAHSSNLTLIMSAERNSVFQHV